MHRPAQILTTAIATLAFVVLLVSHAGQLAPVVLAAAAGLMLLAAVATVHAILRPVERRPIDEAYVRAYDRVTDRRTRSR
ncbi:hypothetical protein [Nonomuraea sp. NPDC049141]|uniref:hypothetical protein n=1 Tax=Nonomuraea sp. NPDC049141 TaxID=3155500 RepID=UPI0033C3BA7B